MDLIIDEKKYHMQKSWSKDVKKRIIMTLNGYVHGYIYMNVRVSFCQEH